MYWLSVFIFFIITLPIQLVISVCVLFTSGPPVFFLQRRAGKDGHPFTLYKFRTMVIGSEHRQQTYMHLNEANGPVFKIRDDPRYTNIGRFLSHTGLDELPQLINILQGDMSLFGPRPLPLYEAKKLLRWQRARQHIKPGILSPWVLDGYHKKRFNDWMKSDLAYVKNKSCVYDAKLFIRSVVFMTKLLYQEIF